MVFVKDVHLKFYMPREKRLVAKREEIASKDRAEMLLHDTVGQVD